MDRDRPSRRGWLLFAAKCAIVAAVAWGVRRSVGRAIGELRAYEFDLAPGWLVLSGALYLVGLIPSAAFWHRLLVRLGQRPRWIDTLRAYYIGHLGKYVPGKAMVVLLRTGLVRGSTVDTKIAAATVLYETLTMMASGAALAAVILVVRFRDQWRLALAAIGLMLLAGLPTLPIVFSRVLRYVDRGDARLDEPLKTIDLGTMAFGWTADAGGWVVLGWSLWAALRGIGAAAGDPFEHLPLLVASVALAVVAGFLSLVPGGAVVREAVLMQLMVPSFGHVAAFVSALVLRVVWLVAEVAISIILYVGGSGPSPHGQPHRESG